MLKRILAGVLTAALTAAPALAEVYTGSTVARRSLQITVEAGGIVEELYVQPGETVEEGDSIARLSTTKVFANQDGTIARIHAGEGQEASGTVLELQPVSRYDIYCTVEEAYAATGNMLVHCGEEIYAYCTYNGTHQGTAMVTSIDGETFMAQATGGEFYNGETVYLYRDADYSYSRLIGIGTVVGAATELYENEGKIVKMHISEGEYVERGELLYEIIDGDDVLVSAPASGIITDCDAAEGDSLQDGAQIATLAAYDDICIAIQVDETMAAAIQTGDQAAMTYACDPGESLVPGEVVEISHLAEDGSYTVYIAPETTPPYLGMTVNVRIGQ